MIEWFKALTRKTRPDVPSSNPLSGGNAAENSLPASPLRFLTLKIVCVVFNSYAHCLILVYFMNIL